MRSYTLDNIRCFDLYGGFFVSIYDAFFWFLAFDGCPVSDFFTLAMVVVLDPLFVLLANNVTISLVGITAFGYESFVHYERVIVTLILSE